MVRDKHEATAEDFRQLRKEVATQRRIYEARYRGIRDKIFAHNEVGNLGGGDLFAKTNIEEIKSLFAFLTALHEALWELIANGRKPTLNVLEFVLPPAPATSGRHMLPGELVAREVNALFDSLVIA
jgi:hypothetical protein